MPFELNFLQGNFTIQNTMKEENPNSCRVLSTSRKDPIVSSFISINISQPKIRIKIPKLIGKAMQRRPQNHKPHDTDNTNDSKNKKKWAKPRNLFPKKVYSMVQNVFGNRNNDAKNQTEEGGKAKSLSFSGIFNKRNGLGFKIKGKSNSSGRNIQRARTMRERGEEEEREERGGKELCKKRILMGEKCRPLNLSGALHYDQNGVLLPEEVHDQLFVNP